ncbi:MAG: bifunctional hydroxymethylpyrimidine kinase/phosphomethylpyrimidine kinase [Gammaproteobacteria bacterium]|nr:bifunctional hydroxymethylpyrimidine kinase/phosphomethylpyrimidine kinase [Gammaproteobacteria bacterium]
MKQNLLSSDSHQQPSIWAIGGADKLGVAADIRVAGANHVHCATIISSISATSTTANKIAATSVELLKIQWRTIALESSTNVCKIGLLVNAEQILWLANKLRDYRQINPELTVIYQPVLVDDEGELALSQQAITQITRYLLPQVDLLMVNYVAMTILSEQSVASRSQAISVGLKFSQHYQLGLSLEVSEPQHAQTNHYYFSLKPADNMVMVTSQKATPNLPASQCTNSSVVASLLAKNYGYVDALILAQGIMAQAIYQPHPLGNARENVFQLSPVNGFNDLPQCYSFEQFIAQSTQNNSLSKLVYSAITSRACATNLGLFITVDHVGLLEDILKLGVKSTTLLACSDDKGEIERAVIEGVALGRQYQARVFIAQHWQLAVKHAAYGIELTLEQCAQADLAVIKDAGLRLGIKVNSLYQALEALKLGPSYLVLGGVMSDEVAVEKLALIAQLLKHRCVVVAKSSATVNEVAQVLASGGDGSNTKCATAIV